MNRPLIVLSAFESRPGAGTEAGLAWNWAQAYLALGYDVELVTHRACVTPESLGQWKTIGVMVTGLGDSTRFVAPTSLLSMVRSRASYAKWIKEVTVWLRSRRPDYVQHLSLSSMVLPLPSAPSGTHFILGPVGGAQRAVSSALRAPSALRESIRAAYGEVAIANRRRHFRNVSPPALALTTNGETEDLARSLGLNPVPMLVDGVDPERIASRAREFRPGGELKLLWAGRLVETKRPDLAVEVLCELRRQGVNASLTIIGEGAFGAKLRATVARLGLEGHVHIAGSRAWTEMWRTYDESDVLLYHSMRDTGCVTIVEAAARGLPVVALRHQAVSYIVPHEVARGPETFSTSAEFVVAAAGHVVSLLDRERYRDASAAALEFARDCSWHEKASAVRGLLEMKSIGTLGRGEED